MTKTERAIKKLEKLREKAYSDIAESIESNHRPNFIDAILYISRIDIALNRLRKGTFKGVMTA